MSVYKTSSVACRTAITHNIYIRHQYAAGKSKEILGCILKIPTGLELFSLLHYLGDFFLSNSVMYYVCTYLQYVFFYVRTLCIYLSSMYVSIAVFLRFFSRHTYIV